MKKRWFLVVLLLILLISGCGKKGNSEKKEEEISPEPWISIDNQNIEADENGQFQITGKSKHSSFSSNINNKVTGILKVDKDGTFVWKYIYVMEKEPTAEISFSTYKEEEKIKYPIKIDYSALVAKQEQDAQMNEQINNAMPSLLNEIVQSSEGKIINIEKKYSNYTSLLVIVPLDIRYESNGNKKKYMDEIGFLIQEKTASTIYPNKEQVPYITFRYDRTQEFLGASDLLIRQRFLLYDNEFK